MATSNDLRVTRVLADIRLNIDSLVSDLFAGVEPEQEGPTLEAITAYNILAEVIGGIFLDTLEDEADGYEDDEGASEVLEDILQNYIDSRPSYETRDPNDPRVFEAAERLLEDIA